MAAVPSTSSNPPGLTQLTYPYGIREAVRRVSDSPCGFELYVWVQSNWRRCETPPDRLPQQRDALLAGWVHERSETFREGVCLLEAHYGYLMSSLWCLLVAGPVDPIEFIVLTAGED